MLKAFEVGTVLQQLKDFLPLERAAQSLYEH